MDPRDRPEAGDRGLREDPFHGDDVLVAEGLLQLVRGPEGDDLSVVDDRDPVAQLLRLVHEVGRVQDRLPFVVQRLHDPPELPRRGHVHRHGGLVEALPRGPALPPDGHLLRQLHRALVPRQAEQRQGCLEMGLRLARPLLREQGNADGHVGKELDRDRPFDQRQVTRRVLEDQRLVDHGELEMSGRVVDRDASVFREEHHEESDRREGEARVEGELAVREGIDDGGELGGAGHERRGEQRHQHRGLGEKADQHLAPCAEAPERGADVHRRERREHAREGEHAHQRDDVRGGREGEAGCEHRNDARGEPHAAEQDVRRPAENRRCVVREHRVLVEELGECVVRQKDGRRRAVLQPGAALVHPAHEERRREHDEHRLQDLESDAGSAAHRTNTSSAIRVMKL